MVIHTAITDKGVRITTADNHRDLIQSVIYGDPTDDEVQRALEAYTAWHLGLTSISEVRRHSQKALRIAMPMWRGLGSVRKE